MKKIITLLSTLVLMLSLAVSISVSASAAGTSFNNAMSISVNTFYTDNISNEYEKDFYKFTLTSPGSIQINFQHENLFDSAEYWYAVLYNTNTNEISSFGFKGTETNIITKKIGLDKGSYYLRITGGDFYEYGGRARKLNTGFFHFSIKYTSSPYFEKENNENFNYATSISVNAAITGSINDERDHDYYKISFDSPGSIYINFKHNNLSDSANYWYAVLYDTNTNEISAYKFYGTDTNINSKKLGLDKGIYYLRITGGDYYDYGGYSRKYNTCDYTFSVNYNPSAYWEKENNENFNFATTVPTNKTISGSINDDRDHDYYKFHINSPGSIYINFKHRYLTDYADYWYAVLYDVNTREISSYKFYGTDTEINSKKLGLDKGTYYLRVVGGNYYDYGGYARKYDDCDYSFTIKYTSSIYWEKELNEDFSNATEINYKTYTGTINDERDNDYYRITLNSTTNIKLSFNSANLKTENEYYRISIYDNSTNEVSKVSVPGNKKNKNIYLSLNKGTYYIRVVGGNYYDYGGYSRCYTTEDYSFTISEYIYVPKVDKIKVSSESTASHTIKWSKTAGVTGYELYRYDTSKKKYVKIKTTSSTKYKASKLKSGTTYKYKVRAYIKKNGVTHYGAFSSVLSAGTKPAKTTLSSVKSSKPAQLTVTWKTVKGASGYQVFCSTSKKFTSKTTKKVTVKKQTSKKTTVKKLKKGKKYYIRVRAYKTVGGKNLYGAYSTVKSAKIKK